MIDFTDEQKRMISLGLTVLSMAAVCAFVAFLTWFVIRVLAIAAPALVPVLFGFFLALFFRPYFRFWKRIVRNPTLALICMTLTVLLPVFGLMYYAGSVVVEQVSRLVSDAPALIARVTEWFHASCPKLHALLMKFGYSFENLGKVCVEYGSSALQAGSTIMKLLTSLVTVLVTLIFFVYFLMRKECRGGDLASHLPFLKEDTKEFVATQIDAFVDILVSFFQRQTVICLIEGCLYGTGFMLVGLPYGFLVGFVLGVLNLIPFFGSVVCLPLALPLAYFSEGGSVTRLLLVLAVWLSGQLLDGYFITPKIQGDKTGIGYVGVIFSFFFWATLLGPLLGMLLAIPLSAFCVVLWRALKARYIKPIV